MPDQGTIKESFRDTIGTVDKEGKRKWLYPTKPKGKLFNKRSYFTVFYLIVFFTLPFLEVNGEPLFLINVLERKFILFGVIFWPQDFFIFGLGLLIFIVFVALFTVIFGRVFCGWACPQTVFMEMLFRRLEYWIEGDASYQKALTKMPMNAEKIAKRGLKYTAFYVLSFIICATLLSYIVGVNKVSDILRASVEKPGALISLLAFTTVFFFVYAWFREQVCIIVCPYGRMQGVLLDRSSIVVAYDYLRGEPREKFSKKRTADKGDCIDCALCVKVCPTGIDIRNGTQLECINCTACIDACDHMMESVKLPPGLIRFDSEKGIAENKKLRFSNRMKAYTAVLLVLIGIETTLLITRSDYDATVLRAKGMLYQERPNGEVSNLYMIKLVNKTHLNQPVDIRIENFDARVEMVGSRLHTVPEGISNGQFFIYIDRNKILDRKTKLVVGVYSNNKKIKTVKTNFLGPIAR